MKITKKKIIIIIVAVAVVLVLFFSFKGGEETEYVTAKVERGDLVQTVSETGMVKAARQIDLNFLQAGKVAKVLATVGQKVKKDQVIAELDYSALSIQKKEAQANLDVARANYNKLLSGATNYEGAVSREKAQQAKITYLSARDEFDKISDTVAENIKQAQKELDDLNSSAIDTPKEQGVVSAQTNLDNTKDTYEQSINNSITDALVEMGENKAVANTALDNINRVLNDNDSRTVLSTANPSYKINTKDTYNESKNLGVAANNILVLAKASPSEINVGQALDDYLKYLNKAFESLNYCYGALENTIITSAFTQAELDALKSNISAQLTLVSSGILGTQTVDQALSDAILAYDTQVSAAQNTLAEKQTSLDDAKLTAQNNLATAMTMGDQQIAVAQTKVDTNKEAWDYVEAQLSELKAPARSHDVSLDQARVRQAEASLELVKNKIQDSIIKAPIDGTVTNIEYEVGEQTSAANPAVSVLGENNFEVEVDISEADIAKIRLNNPAEITLDAFGDDIKFIGKIYFIEPAETVIQDVIYYKVKIQFLDQANLENIKSGMTANIVLTTARKENVLMAPSRAIIEKNGPSASSGQASKYVRILKGNKITEMPVTTGLRGDGGMVEVLSGAEEGQVVVTQIKDSK